MKFAGKEMPFMVSEESRVEDRVKDLGERLAQTLLQGDSTAAAELLGEGFVLRLPDGERIFKEELLRLLANRQVRYDSLSLDLADVHVYDGQVAFLSGHCAGSKQFREQRLDGRHPFTALCVNRRGTWQIVALHYLVGGESVPTLPRKGPVKTQ